ncbi:hypothetical protein PV328_012371 [Microctonus aethiopoides]|uniref:Uncharacterized protein n=1 Tax=Microctonus aethiopoides TaxID=144406 RepID=A0AA39C3J9_9HYME|nr:hypothetical protein PV328_012371 [Microctonus aethiopoides]
MSGEMGKEYLHQQKKKEPENESDDEELLGADWKPPPAVQRMLTLMEENRVMIDRLEHWHKIFKEFSSLSQVSEYLDRYDVK